MFMKTHRILFKYIPVPSAVFKIIVSTSVDTVSQYAYIFSRHDISLPKALKSKGHPEDRAILKMAANYLHPNW